MTSCAEFDQIRAPARPRASLFTWILNFFHVRERRRLALKDLQRLDDRELRDIGIKRHDITAIVDREIGRLRLDEFRSRL
ncbi:hypothetical protein MAXJ12_20137 [Mesorhizobium alhagi CCNWXJ12-2]|jgi:uncharacterized protein YjiS (DUF1127 family)|uniref:YjiS-like domain-containing protein n=1 Tax=Mesorhizobium alhagi CCNWXJ12-2 TaxID=1107882 RepID=H0HV24_9HYPH|nr:DUF1127 domain-containing protein [Mesorhizobium alhagi]EHK55422.1 hypothetical protein MAXJ12_20137 [Mesorhizobium alhagi CCNWXJ12-2]